MVTKANTHLIQWREIVCQKESKTTKTKLQKNQGQEIEPYLSSTTASDCKAV